MQLMSRSNVPAAKHSKMLSLLSKLQKLKLYHAENYDFPSQQIASIKTCLRTFSLNQHVLTLPWTENRNRHAFEIHKKYLYFLQFIQTKNVRLMTNVNFVQSQVSN